MITKDGGLKFAKLIHVSVDNGMTAQSNKVYIMEEESDGRIKCEYGRVGKNLVTVYKQSYEWDKVYNSKVNPRKGYTDVTDMVSETVVVDTSGKKKSKTNDIKDLKVKNIFDDLMAFANKSIKQNYKVSQEAVTQLQVDRAQDILNRAVKLVNKKMNIKEFNNVLIELYTVIPRKMDDVRDHLASSANDDGDLNWINNFLSGEQDTLDAMAGQVKLINQQKDADAQSDEIGEDDADQQVTILEQMGLKASIETDQKSIDLVTKLMGSNSGRIRKILKIVNVKTQGAFDRNLKKSKDKTRRLYWHGSRNENWFNIIQTGLMIRPSGAVHTGSMFGDGIYFANKAQKSIGYSSLRGSYWAGGSSNKGYLALFDVHTGNQKHITRHDSSCYSLSKSVMDREGTDSVYAHGGMDLRNDEFIVYEASKCTISYLVEME